MNKKQLVVACFFILFSFSNAFAFSDIEDYFDRLMFVDLQVSAVTIEMYGVLGWFSDDKESVSLTSKAAEKELDFIKSSLMGLKVPNELQKAKDIEIEAIDRIREAYNGIADKKEEMSEKEFKAVAELRSKFSAEIIGVFEKNDYFGLSEDKANQLEEETKFIKTDEDKRIYREAYRLIETKKSDDCTKAYSLLKPLSSKYVNSAGGDCISLRISDCYLMAASQQSKELEKKNEEGLKLLNKIVDSKRYSPALYEAFYKWRTTEQSINHGMSNMSEIPNKEYNEKRWEVIEVIKKHLAQNPNDVWAREQITLLLLLENIDRGGKMGNRNLEHWGLLYYDLSSSDSVKDKNE